MKKKEFEGIIALVILGGIIAFIGALIEMVKGFLNFLIQNPSVPIIVGLIFICCLFFYFKQKNELLLLEEQKRKKATLEAQEKRKEFLKKLNQVTISDKREDYIFKKEDYKRGNKREREYRKMFLLKLLSLYGNKCAKCGDTKNGFDLDHFIFSKNEGGNFALMHKDGHLVNNAIPLCQKCNRSKGDRSYKDFFTENEILSCFTKNREMTLKLNEEA